MTTHTTYSIVPLVSIITATMMLSLGCDKKTQAQDADVVEKILAKANAKIPDYAEKATFAAGCFWGVESAYQQIDGVITTSVGYTGGKMIAPSYKDVCAGRTGHTEAVEVIFDPNKVSYEKLVDTFWKIHDPTTLNQQGPDFGTQYRSAIFFHNLKQQATATTSKQALQHSGRFKQDIVTEITKATPFYRAEDYHQSYLAKRGKTACHNP